AAPVPSWAARLSPAPASPAATERVAAGPRSDAGPVPPEAAPASAFPCRATRPHVAAGAAFRAAVARAYFSRGAWHTPTTQAANSLPLMARKATEAFAEIGSTDYWSLVTEIIG